MINAGVGLYTEGAVLGHRDTRATQRYSHVTVGTLTAAVDTIGRQKAAHAAHKKAARRRLDFVVFTYGGEGGIRTHGTLRYA